MKPLLIDTNILLLHIVGSHDTSLIERFKRTAIFSANDFEILRDTIRGAELISTPAVMAEVSNLLPTALHQSLSGSIVSIFRGCAERVLPKQSVVGNIAFSRLGFTDSSIAVLAAQKTEVLTDDWELYMTLAHRGLPVTNFNHLRKLLGS